MHNDMTKPMRPLPLPVLNLKANILPEQIARVCHEVNKAYCESLGDMSQPSWVDAPAWQKESAINGVIFHLENPDAGPSASHDSWMKEKLADGWEWGPRKDPEKKLHPCILAFRDLPVEQQAKDYIFSAIVRSVVEAFTP